MNLSLCILKINSVRKLKTTNISPCVLHFLGIDRTKIIYQYLWKKNIENIKCLFYFSLKYFEN